MNILQRYPFKWKSSRTITPELAGKVVIDDGVSFYKYKDLVNQRVEVLDLSARSNNALRRHAVNTLGDIAERYAAIPNIKGIGAKCIDEIKTKFMDYYVWFMENYHPENAKNIFV